MLGNILNVVAIIVGGLLGAFLKEGIKENHKDIIIGALGLSALVMGITSAIKTENLILMIISLIVGSLVGESLDIEHRMDGIGEKLSKALGKEDSDISRGLVTSTLVFCIGAMAIMGPLEAGLNNDNSVLYVKAILDGITALIFASNLGIGVVFSVVPVFIYQSSITLLAFYIKDFISPDLILELSAVGGVLIMAIGLNLLDLKKMRVGNMLPSVLIPVLYFLILK